MKKILFSAFCAFTFFGCGDGLVEFSKEELKNENYAWAFKKIEEELETNNLKFYKLESIEKSNPKIYSYWKRQEESNDKHFYTHIYVINKDKNNLPYLFSVRCSKQCVKYGRVYDKSVDLSR